MKSQQNKLSGCASNLLAHEDLGNFEETHCWNIQAKFYNEKLPLVYESDNIRDSLSWRSWCYFEAQVWKKIVTLSPFFIFFSPLFSFLFLGLFFLWPFFFFFFLAFFFSFWPSFFYKGQCSNNDDHHTSIYLQLMDYNSILEQDMTLYEGLRRCTGICNESRATCMKIMKVALPQIQCQLNDHAKSNMTKLMRVIWTERWKVAGQYISEWLWKCHNR